MFFYNNSEGFMSKKYICMIVYTLYPFDARVRREAETLSTLDDIDVTVLCLKEKKIKRSYQIESVNITELNASKYTGNSKTAYIFSYLFFSFLAFFYCSKLFFNKKIDIVHIHNMPNFLVFSAVIPKLFGKKLILDMHDSLPDTFSCKFGSNNAILFKILCFEEKISAWLSNRIICVNDVQKEVTVNRGINQKKIFVSMNVPDHKKFLAIEKTKETLNKCRALKIVYHGTLTKRLGIDLAVDAVKKLTKQIPGIEFHIWGRGDYAPVLQEENSKSNFIFLHDSIPIEKLPEALSMMDIGIIPNRKNIATELMLPVKLMEYFTLGIPVVAPKLKAIEHYFSDDMISFYDPENIESMAKAILEIYKNDERKKIQQVKAKEFLEIYGWETQSIDFLNFYLGLLNE